MHHQDESMQWTTDECYKLVAHDNSPLRTIPHHCAPSLIPLPVRPLYLLGVQLNWRTPAKSQFFAFEYRRERDCSQRIRIGSHGTHGGVEPVRIIQM